MSKKRSVSRYNKLTSDYQVIQKLLFSMYENPKKEVLEIKYKTNKGVERILIKHLKGKLYRVKPFKKEVRDMYSSHLSNMLINISTIHNVSYSYIERR